MYFGYFGSHERIFPLEKTNIHRLIKEKVGRGGGGGGRATPPSYLEPRLRDLNRKLLFVLCFVLFM